MIRSILKKWLLRHDAIISRPPGQFHLEEIKLIAARDRGLKVKSAIDGGAARGSFTRTLRGVFPDAEVLCVEPRDEVQGQLTQMATELGRIRVAQTLVGECEGEVDFSVHDAQSSILGNRLGERFGRQLRARMTTLDKLVEELGMPPPDLIKLDLQGAELRCLEGAQRSLAHAEAVMLEVSFIPFQKGMPLMEDVTAFLKPRGFRCYDILALWHRPLDGALAQGDFLFLHERSPLLADSRWSRDAAWA